MYDPDEIFGADIFDSRTAQEAIDWLEIDQDNNDEDETANLTDLQALRDEWGDTTSWDDGVTFIRDGYFTDYAQEYADEIGAIDGDAGWPINCIDWDEAASDLKQDYTQVDLRGKTYWGRA